MDDPAREILADYATPCYEIVRRGGRAALIGVGNFFYLMEKAADLLKSDGIDVTLINPRCVSALDTAALDTLRDYDIVITAEDGIVDGGFGQKVAAYLGESPVKVKCLGLPKEFLNEYDPATVAHECGLEPGLIAGAVKKEL